MADFGSIAVANSPSDFAKMLREETDQWAKSLKDDRPQEMTVRTAKL